MSGKLELYEKSSINGTDKIDSDLFNEEYLFFSNIRINSINQTLFLEKKN